MNVDVNFLEYFQKFCKLFIKLLLQESPWIHSCSLRISGLSGNEIDLGLEAFFVASASVYCSSTSFSSHVWDLK